MEGRIFYVLTDHKPLTHALSSKPDSNSPHQICHLEYISQVTTDICHIKREDNTAADAPFKISNTNTVSSVIDFQEIAKAQLVDEELQQL